MQRALHATSREMVEMERQLQDFAHRVLAINSAVAAIAAAGGLSIIAWRCLPAHYLLTIAGVIAAQRAGERIRAFGCPRAPKSASTAFYGLLWPFKAVLTGRALVRGDNHGGR